MENITLKEILTTYWSQVTLLILGVAYFMKNLIDLKSKKTELNHNLFQERKLNALNSFFKSYSSIYLMWYNFTPYSVINGRYNLDDLDDMIFTKLNELNTIVLELKIYFNKKNHQEFEYILASMYNINALLKKIVFTDNSENRKQLIDDFEKYKKEVFELNQKTISTICENIKKNFS